MFISFNYHFFGLIYKNLKIIYIFDNQLFIKILIHEIINLYILEIFYLSCNE